MALKVKKEAPVPLKAEAKARSLKAKKAVLKGIHSHKKRMSDVIYLPMAQNTVAQEASQISSEERLSEKQA